jgi:hypothetical protein
MALEAGPLPSDGGGFYPDGLFDFRPAGHLPGLLHRLLRPAGKCQSDGAWLGAWSSAAGRVYRICPHPFHSEAEIRLVLRSKAKGDTSVRSGTYDVDIQFSKGYHQIELKIISRVPDVCSIVLSNWKVYVR